MAESAPLLREFIWKHVTRVRIPPSPLNCAKASLSRPNWVCSTKPSFIDMWYVYVLKSTVKDWMYIGYSSNLKSRVEQHNSGNVQSTKHYAPFELEAYVAVKTKQKAIELEKYFKTGSGKAVLKKRILGL